MDTFKIWHIVYIIWKSFFESKKESFETLWKVFFSCFRIFFGTISCMGKFFFTDSREFFKHFFVYIWDKLTNCLLIFGFRIHPLLFHLPECLDLLDQEGFKLLLSLFEVMLILLIFYDLCGCMVFKLFDLHLKSFFFLFA